MITRPAGWPNLTAMSQTSRPRAARPGRPPATSREEIATSALRLAREQGLDAVTIRGLAEFMGVAPMTLYKYVKTKDEVIDIMVATALASFESRPDPSKPWPDQLHAIMMSLYETLSENSVVVELLVDSHALMGTAIDQTRDAALTLIDESSLSPDDALDAFHTLGAFVVGLVAVEAGRAKRAVELTGHLYGLSDKDYPAISRSRDAWMRPLSAERVADGLWSLIKGFTGA
jgi:AcrR family transcriptional regulator